VLDNYCAGLKPAVTKAFLSVSKYIDLNINIRKYHPTDWQQVSKIYLEGINTKNATFETNVPAQNEWEN